MNHVTIERHRTFENKSHPTDQFAVASRLDYAHQAAMLRRWVTQSLPNQFENSNFQMIHFSKMFTSSMVIATASKNRKLLKFIAKGEIFSK